MSEELLSLTGTPFTPRLGRLNSSNNWAEWANGDLVWLRPESFGNHHAAVTAMRESAVLEDKSPLAMYFFSGPDAEAFLQKLVIRDVSRLQINSSIYIVFCDDEGHVVIDGVLFRLGENEYCYTATPIDKWLAEHRAGFDVEISLATNDWGILHVQGPNAFEVVAKATGENWDELKFGRGARTRLGGVDIRLWRVGFAGERGFELWVPAAEALPAFDALVSAGEPYGLEHLGDLAEDVCRIEAGLVLPVIDYTMAGPDLFKQDSDPTAPQSVQWLATPAQIGAERFVEFGKADFLGREALLAEQERGGPSSRLVGVELNWRDIVAGQERIGRPPRVPERVQRFPLLPIRSTEHHAGYASSVVWSSWVNGLVGLARIEDELADPGSDLRLSWSEAGETWDVGVTLSELPFLKRKRS
ncbi:aminomethyltransferase family protein [Candidatus Poriferisocius sp.]|uniref:aminomethyltransferase family protein n=1 Tax=Candidatus Poriferisocius sp. TaxID=3101276 RepID=UPI003B01CCBD